MHYILHCPVYEPLRTGMIVPISIVKPSFTFYTNEEKLQYLLSNTSAHTSTYQRPLN